MTRALRDEEERKHNPFASFIPRNPSAVHAILRHVQAPIQSLENQVGKLAKVSSDWPQGSLPSDTEANP